MTDIHSTTIQPTSTVPADDPGRKLSVVDADDPRLRHLAVVGDTYTILLSGAETAGKYCLIDMSVPQCGGPGPHRHDFEEMFHLLDGEIEFTFRGEKHVVKAGMTVNIHQHRRGPRADAVHVHARGSGGVLPGHWHPGRQPHRARACAKPGGAGGVPEEGRGARTAVPYRAAQAVRRGPTMTPTTGGDTL